MSIIIYPNVCLLTLMETFTNINNTLIQQLVLKAFYNSITKFSDLLFSIKIKQMQLRTRIHKNPTEMYVNIAVFSISVLGLDNIVIKSNSEVVLKALLDFAIHQLRLKRMISSKANSKQIVPKLKHLEQREKSG
ncbi:unnamed protein product [Paramecium octaurelia]|uniref:Uncharacterized protein n=1 Tax=Paramecium octaurelia TaxID=43137 RepID=A0A8S1URQ0_PAROT|nr:unnamed protein product [Paramecium octaurelia]